MKDTIRACTCRRERLPEMSALRVSRMSRSPTLD